MNLADRLAEIEAREKAATRGAEIVRYQHGGGRLAVFGDGECKIVADFYSEGDREFYVSAREDVPYLLAACQVLAEALQRATLIPGPAHPTGPDALARALDLLETGELPEEGDRV